MNNEETRLICANCGREIENNDSFTFEGDCWCEDCYYERVSTCDCCGEDFDNSFEDMTFHNDSLYCESCRDRHLFRCDDCGDWHDQNNRITTYNDSEICYLCYDSEYFTCESCGYVYHIDELRGDNFCGSCYSDSSNDILHDYNYSPSPIFHNAKDENSNIYMGIEVEAECGVLDCDSVITEWQDALNNDSETDFYAKHDGSLNHGVEFVSHPRSLASWQEFKPQLQAACKAVTGLGVRSHETTTCGLHIHVSRNNMSEYHKIRLAALIYGNPTNIQALARRNSVDYAKYKDIKKGCYREILLQNSRYEAINWENKNTVEFRFFRGTLNTETLLSSIELTHAAYMFTERNISTAILITNPDLAWKRFGDYIIQNKKRYMHLISYAKRVLPEWL